MAPNSGPPCHLKEFDIVPRPLRIPQTVCRYRCTRHLYRSARQMCKRSMSYRSSRIDQFYRSWREPCTGVRKIIREIGVAERVFDRVTTSRTYRYTIRGFHRRHSKCEPGADKKWSLPGSDQTSLLSDGGGGELTAALATARQYVYLSLPRAIGFARAVTPTAGQR